MTDFHRVFKKSKHEAKCTELFLKLEHNVSMYLLNIDNFRYILLDKHWCFVREYDFDPVEIRSLFACYEQHENPPTIVFVRKAKRRLDADIFNTLIQCYQKHVSYTWQQTVLPIDDLDINRLISTYDDDPCDYLLQMLFSYLQKQTKPLFIHTGSLYFNNMVRVLTWKGYVKWLPHRLQQTVFDHLINKEMESLFLITLARNRPAKDNFFAQMTKDVLFKKIFPLIKWSLPFYV